jgi:hypothetical protein
MTNNTLFRTNSTKKPSLIKPGLKYEMQILWQIKAVIHTQSISL